MYLKLLKFSFIFFLFSINFNGQNKFEIYVGPVSGFKEPEIFEFIDLIKRAGFNSIFLPIGFSEDALKIYKYSSEKDFKIFIKIGGVPFDKNLRIAINEKGKEERLNCPIQKEVWQFLYLYTKKFFDKFKGEDFLKNIAGIYFDVERFVDADICYCDECFYSFLKSKNIKEEVKIFNRKRYLFEKNLMREYTEFERERMIDILKEIEEKIHEVNPELIISYYPLFWRKPFFPKSLFTLLMPEKFPPPLWWHFYRKSGWVSLAVIKGLGKKESPVLAWDDYYYWSGYSSDPYYPDRVKKFLRNYLGYEAWWFPSILYVTSCRFKGEFTPERAYNEYKKLVSISNYGAILYGESEKGKSLWETHEKFLKEFERH
jgi:hypothetical protein